MKKYRGVLESQGCKYACTYIIEKQEGQPVDIDLKVQLPVRENMLSGVWIKRIISRRRHIPARSESGSWRRRQCNAV